MTAEVAILNKSGIALAADSYLYPVCPTCAGANYLVNKTFKLRNKSKCRLQKLIALFAADMEAKRIAKDPSRYDETTLFYTIEAIKQIRERYLGEFITGGWL